MIVILFLMVLTGAHGKENTKYDVLVRTGTGIGAGTGARVFIKLYGEKGESLVTDLNHTSNQLLIGSNSKFEIDIGNDIGTIKAIKIGHDNTGMGAAWLLNKVEVFQIRGLKISHFIVGRWLCDKCKTSSTTAVYVEKEESENCGDTFKPAVIDGYAPANQWPWLAQIKKLNTPLPHHCSGTLVHPEWVLTAASCVYKSKAASGYEVTLGKHNIGKKDYTEQKFKLSKILVHPEYSPGYYSNDIALLKLRKPANLNTYVNIACLPYQKEKVRNGRNCYLAGWGKTDNRDESTKTLKQVLLPKVPSTTCEKAVNKYGSISIGIKLMCFGGEEQSSCIGDFGSPIVCPEYGRGRWFLQGVMNWVSPKCNEKGSYTVNARVAQFSDWIKTNIYSRYIRPIYPS